MRVKATVLWIQHENVVVTKRIKLNKMDKKYCKKEKKINEKKVIIIIIMLRMEFELKVQCLKI